MPTELTTTPHPHDPHANDLTWSQTADLLRYFTPPGKRYHFHHSGTTMVHIFDGAELLTFGLDRDQPAMDCCEDALRKAGLWPDRSMAPPPPQFVAVGGCIMRAQEPQAWAVSHNMAHRIANALNWYVPGRRGR